MKEHRILLARPDHANIERAPCGDLPVVVVLLGGGVHLLHGFQVHRQADALKVASERAEATFVKLRTACVRCAGADACESMNIGGTRRNCGGR